MIKSLRMNISIIFEKKVTYIVFFILLGSVLNNYFLNIKAYAGMDVNTMIHPMRLLFLSSMLSDGSNMYFLQYYPLFVVIPAAFLYINDKSSEEIVFIESRVGRKNYYLGKYLATFLGTFIIYTVPFLVEYVLNCIAFPLGSTGDINGGLIVSQDYLDRMGRYLFPDLWMWNNYVYSFLYIIGIGVLTGLLTTFAMAVSTFKFMKFKALIFLPVYVLIYMASALRDLLNLPFSTNYYMYISMFDDSIKSEWALLLFVVFLIGSIVTICIRNIRKDEL